VKKRYWNRVGAVDGLRFMEKFDWTREEEILEQVRVG
jgi:hypothetical protein